jgi:hypothetical protein
LFTADDLIYVYTDEQAIEDGILVDLAALGCSATCRGLTVDRMTAHLFFDVIPFLIDADHALGPQPQKIEDLVPGHLKSLRSLLQTKIRYASDMAQPGEEPGVIYQAPLNLWLVRNERGNFTLMYPSDY